MKTSELSLRCQVGSDRFIPDRREISGKTVQDFWIETAIPEPGRLSAAARWSCALRFVHDQRGRPVVGEVRIFPNESDPARNSPYRYTPGRWSAEEKGYRAVAPLGGVTARHLRNFRLGDRAAFFAKNQKLMAREFERDRQQGSMSPYLQGEASQWLVASVPAPVIRTESRGRRPSFTDLDCAKLAREYADLIAAKDRSPVATLLRQHPDLKTITRVRMRIHLARKRGLLSLSSGQGYRGGVLTPKALELLAGNTRVQPTKRSGVRRSAKPHRRSEDVRRRR